jgi:hypothetical protein
MSDAPERIWVAPWREGDWSEGDWDDNEGKTLNDKPCIEYVRTDRIEALTDKLSKAEAGLLAIAKRDEQMIWGEDYEVEEAFKDMRDISCATLAEIKGESYE